MLPAKRSKNEQQLIDRFARDAATNIVEREWGKFVQKSNQELRDAITVLQQQGESFPPLPPSLQRLVAPVSGGGGGGGGGGIAPHVDVKAEVGPIPSQGNATCSGAGGAARRVNDEVMHSSSSLQNQLTGNRRRRSHADDAADFENIVVKPELVDADIPAPPGVPAAVAAVDPTGPRQAVDMIPVHARDEPAMGGGSTSLPPKLFRKDAFLSEPLFHLNPFINSSTANGAPRMNKGFGPFIREQVATPGFHMPCEAILHKLRLKALATAGGGGGDGGEEIDGLDCRHVSQQMLTNPEVRPQEAKQVAIWTCKANVGSFIIMRHTYGECPYTPAKLKTRRLLPDNVDGADRDELVYGGPVYAIGVITEKLVPGSDDDKKITSLIPEIGNTWNHSYARVAWCRLGSIDDLSDGTRAYINSVQQPTINEICGKTADGNWRQWPSSGTNAQQVRRDFWEKANVNITATDFPERFGQATNPDNGTSGTLEDVMIVIDDSD